MGRAEGPESRRKGQQRRVRRSSQRNKRKAVEKRGKKQREKRVKNSVLEAKKGSCFGKKSVSDDVKRSAVMLSLIHISEPTRPSP